jgi:hypothetical protein
MKLFICPRRLGLALALGALCLLSPATGRAGHNKFDAHRAMSQRLGSA